MISFIVYGEPVAQGRPKFTTISGHAKAYDPEKSKSYKERVYYEALKVKPDKLLQGPLSITVIVYRSIPKSLSKIKHQLAANGYLRPVTKPDLDNVIKGIKDALKAVIWQDDSQVVVIVGEKWYSDNPRVEISISEV